MNDIRACRLGSFAQIISIICFLSLAFGYASKAKAITKAECLNKKNSGTYTKLSADDRKDCDAYGVDDGEDSTKPLTDEQQKAADARKKKARTDSLCDEATRELRYKKDDYYKACKDAGMGASTCKDKVSTCDDTGGDAEYDGRSTSTGTALLAAFSEAAGVPQSEVSSSCPKYSGQGFYERKDKLESKLKDINKDLKTNKQDTADLNKDFTDKVKEIQEDIAKAQKEYQEKQTDIKKGQRDRAAEQAKQAAEMASNVRKLESGILAKQQEKDTIYADKNSSLAQLTEDVANSSCMDEVRKDYEARKAMSSSQKGSSKTLISSGNSKNARMKMIFNQCMNKFYTARMKLIQQADAKVETADKDIRNAQSDLDNLKTQMSQTATLEQQAQQDEQTTLTNEQKALSDKIQRAQSELQSLQQTTQQKAQALQQEQQDLTKESKSISNQIAGLGPAPNDATSTGKMADVSAAADAYNGALRSAQAIENCSVEDSVFGKKAKKNSNTGNGTHSSNGQQ